MAEEDESGGERTEDPTQKRLDEALERGDVAKSQEVNTWFMISGATLVLSTFASSIGGIEVPLRNLDAADGAGKGRENKRCARDHEPGVDLLALGDVPTLQRLIETFLRGVFRAFAAGLVFFGHLLHRPHLRGIIWCMTPMK